MASIADARQASVKDWLDLHEIMNVKLAMEEEAQIEAEKSMKGRGASRPSIPSRPRPR